MNIRMIRTPEKREIVKELNKQFGIENLPYLLIETGKEKFRAFSGHMNKDEIFELSKIARIEIIGLYFLKKEQDFRLSIDATHLLKNQINKNIFELDEQQFQSWIRGRDIETQSPHGTLVISHNKDFIGCGKSNGKIIFNYVPKDRRLKKN